MKKEQFKKLVLFASGSGTNAENIINYFKNHQKIKVVKVLTNNSKAKVIERANRLKVSVEVFSKQELINKSNFSNYIAEADYLILAGFLWKIPTYLIHQFPNKIINIHPALLPNYGGKGMYGMHVHESVFKNKEKESGITIHFVNENYDEGAIIFQEKVSLTENDLPKTIAAKIHELEYLHFPKIIERVILNEN
ncbi:MAG: phosphoribosylglycinamide formyltransferase [Lutibacter sp.]